jgi:hypothetical protein
VFSRMVWPWHQLISKRDYQRHQSIIEASIREVCLFLFSAVRPLHWKRRSALSKTIVSAASLEP